MEFVDKMESNAIQLDIMVKTLMFLSEDFADRIHEDYSYLLKGDDTLFYELQSLQTLLESLAKSLSDLQFKFQKDIDLFYENLK